MSFAEGTRVPVEKSKSEIERLVTKHGASAFSSSWTGDNARIVFRMRDRYLRFDLRIPPITEFTRRYRARLSPEQHREAEVRRRWRALLLNIKAKLEAVESGIELFEQAFLANILMPDGRTVGETAIPAIAEAYETGEVKPLLLEAGGR